MNIILWIGTVVIAVIAWINLPNSFWQYLFFLRVPLLLGTLLVALPLIATQWLRAMLRNLFAMRGRWQISSAIVSAIMAGMAVVLVTNIILSNASDRFGIVKWITIPEIWQYVLAIILGLPICVTIIILSQEQSIPLLEKAKISDADRWIGAVTGIVISICLLFLVSWTRYWLFSQESIKQLLIKVIYFLGKADTAGYIVQSGNPPQPDLARGHLTALGFFLVELVIYLIVAYGFQPKAKTRRKEAPALLYVMVLITAATLFLGGMTFFFDFYRVLPLLLLLLGSIASYSLFKVDHFFQLHPLQSQQENQPTPPEWEDFGAVLSKRLQHQSGKKTLVIICASGGGIQAAGWTAQVLIGLQQVIGDSFAKAIGLISSVSGGSVGAMYYIDQINLQTHIPTPGDLNVFISATCDSLDAVGWGLVYPDLWRVIGLPFLAPKLSDRGAAIETDWQGEMKDAKNITWLSTWRAQVLEGQIPIPIFNSTIVDTGDRFLISPMSFYEFITKRENLESDKNYKFKDFNTLYGNYDMSVVTAARLSATFPYLSPVCRPWIVKDDQNVQPQKVDNFHFADGGYFDNSGAFTALEWLNQLLSSQQNPEIERVMIVQINPFPKDSNHSQSQTPKNQGWIMGVVGPLLALFKVRDSTRLSRNDQELELLKQCWKQDLKHPVEIENYSIFFPSFGQMGIVETQLKEQFSDNARRQDDFTYFFNNKGKYEPPLSWKLTDAEKKAIQQGWKLIVSDHCSEVQKMKNKWAEWGMASS